MATLEEKAIQKREAILKATLDLIFERGFYGTPMSLIADEAGIGFGTIYRYFKNKESLITELFREIKTELSNAMMKDHFEKDTIKDQYSKIVYNLLIYFMNNPKKFKFIEQFTFSPFINKKARDEIELDVHKPILLLYEKGFKSGKFKKIPFELVFSLTYGTISTLINLHIDGQFNLNEKNIQIAVNSCWDSVKA